MKTPLKTCRNWSSSIALCLLSSVCVASLAVEGAFECTDVLYSVILNQTDTHEISHLLKDRQGDLWVAAPDLTRWRLTPPPSTPIHRHQQTYYRMRDLVGANWRIDELQGKLYVSLGADAFSATDVDLLNQYDGRKLVPEFSHGGAFLNYRLFSQKHESDRHSSPLQTNTAVELGIFKNAWVLTNNFIVNNIGNTNKNAHANRAVRLNTTWSIDRPDSMQNWQIGDIISTPGLWGTSVNFGGIQWGSKFRTQPYVSKVPLPSAKGAAILPSKLDVYVNNIKMAERQLQPGPYVLNNLPVMSGAGEIKLLTTDVLGHEESITIPYYSDATMLQKHLHDFSFELGCIRHDYGYSNAHYGKLIFSGNDAYGLTDWLTTQNHVEFSQTTQNLGTGVNLNVANYGVLTAAIAGSHSDGTRHNKHSSLGSLGLLSFNRSADKFNYGLSTKMMSEDFRPIAFYRETQPSRIENTANLGLNNILGGSLGLSYINKHERFKRHKHHNLPNSHHLHGDSLNYLSATYSSSFWNQFYFLANGTTNIHGHKHKRVYLQLSTMLDSTTNISMEAIEHNHNQQYLASVQKSLPTGSGYGYRLQASTGDSFNKFYAGRLDLQNNVGTYSVETDHSDSNDNYRFMASGGLVLLNSNVFATRNIYDSVAVVHIPEYANIPVYLENQKVSTTNKHGYALLPNLQSYMVNHISINPEDFPLGTEVGATNFDVTSYYHGGIFREFNVTKNASATLTVKLPTGNHPTPGTVVTVNDSPELSYITDNGELYLGNLRNGINKVTVELANADLCSFEIDYKQSTDPLPNLGTYVCRGKN